MQNDNASQTYQYVPNHLLLGVLTTIFCCLPFGIVSIIYAVQVNTALAAGNAPMAQVLSEKAKFWGMLGLWIGIALQVISLLFALSSGAFMAMMQQTQM